LLAIKARAFGKVKRKEGREMAFGKGNGKW